MNHDDDVLDLYKGSDPGLQIARPCAPFKSATSSLHSATKIELVCSSCHEEDKMKDTNPSKNDTMDSIELIKFLKDKTRIALHYIDHISSNTMRHA